MRLLLMCLVVLTGMFGTIVGLFYSVAENSVAALLASIVFAAFCFLAVRGIDQ